MRRILPLSPCRVIRTEYPRFTIQRRSYPSDPAMQPDDSPFTPSCPVPNDPSHVILAHGGGGRMTQKLLETLFFRVFDNPILARRHDGAVLETGAKRLAFTTDSYVVDPLFFPGGDIGELAVYGTVNDLAVCGAEPRWISAGFIIEEGLPMEVLARVAASMRRAADRAGVSIVTGDTKVVPRGRGDGIFINTAGVGIVPEGVEIDPAGARPGDVVIINGPIADHGIAIMALREGLDFETPVVSDTAPLHTLAAAVLQTCPTTRVLRDPTRGGVASALNEIARASSVGIVLDETSVPVRDAVRGACEILGFDPLYVANEGKLIVIAPGDAAGKIVERMRELPEGRESCAIGMVTSEHPGTVVMRTLIGGTRIVDMMSGEQLPRIC
ncbi:MAG: hydrogenase expression/formation protein HypE [Bacteroidota bacterium]|nr:hydrogenase expression/formation protein HypE [Bacteroidota bacterium]